MFFAVSANVPIFRTHKVLTPMKQLSEAIVKRFIASFFRSFKRFIASLLRIFILRLTIHRRFFLKEKNRLTLHHHYFFTEISRLKLISRYFLN
jgi:hypothetical protein